jgi:hypothetical protein
MSLKSNAANTSGGKAGKRGKNLKCGRRNRYLTGEDEAEKKIDMKLTTTAL